MIEAWCYINNYLYIPFDGLVKCPDCELCSPAEWWPEQRVYCDDCGDHPGTDCPLCGERYDLIFRENLQEVNPKPWIGDY